MKRLKLVWKLKFKYGGRRVVKWKRAKDVKWDAVPHGKKSYQNNQAWVSAIVEKCTGLFFAKPHKMTRHEKAKQLDYISNWFFCGLKRSLFVSSGKQCTSVFYRGENNDLFGHSTDGVHRRVILFSMPMTLYPLSVFNSYPKNDRFNMACISSCRQ